YLIDIVRDSFDLAMKKDKRLAKLLLNKWQLYPYSLFYRLILYAITKHANLDEKIVIRLFENKPDQILWSSTCKRELLKFLRDRSHSKETIKKILTLIKKGPPQSKDIEKEYIERAIYLRLHHLKFSGAQFPKDVEKLYKAIPIKYSFKPSTKKEAERESFSFYIREPTQIGSEKRYHNMACEEIFKEIKYTEPNTRPSITDKKENFRFFIRDYPEKAYKVLLKFKDKDINSYPYWSIFISEVSSIKNKEEGNNYFLNSLQKIKKFENDFFKKNLWSLIYALEQKSRFLYHNDKTAFKKWWNKLWDLSIKDTEFHFDSDISLNALNSHLGKLTQSIFQVLWSKFSDKKMKRNEKITEEIKAYFEIIITKGSLKDPSVLYHFGSYLWDLWFLDKEWISKKLKKLMDWNQKENLCKALWIGWLYYPKWCPDFLDDFKSEIFQLILNRKKFYKTNQENVYKQGFSENIASILFITTGGRESKNIFTNTETRKLIQSMDTDVLEPLSRQMWKDLEDSKNKSSILWSEKIKPWIEECWSSRLNLKNPKTAENLSFLILHCGNKLPKTFNLLKDKIEGVIQRNNEYISHYIIKKMNKELNYIFDYPTELLQILNWNFPKDRINEYMGGKEIKQILEKLKEKDSSIEQNSKYKKLSEKLDI
ncbi:MAG: hypothetical protein OXN83_04895, partial [Oligoflexia bacterium]|nr:hypothetical protein [Oligoflexia bacterium]